MTMVMERNDEKLQAVFARHYNRFREEGYDEIQSCLIANLFERSVRNSQKAAYEVLPEMRQLGSLSLHITVDGVELYAHQGFEAVAHEHISLEEALLLHNNGIVEFDRNGKHIMEHYGLM